MKTRAPNWSILLPLALAAAAECWALEIRAGEPARQTTVGRSSWGALLREHGVRDERVLRAMDKVRRADFLPADELEHEFEDRPLVIGHEQTTSQPSLIAQMIESMQLRPGCHVLEVGTGSGYQTALLAELCEKVATVEIVEPLATRARTRLTALGYRNVKVKVGDGYLGWSEEAPFDGIVVSAGAARIPAPLVAQLRAGALMVIPVGERDAMTLRVVTQSGDGGWASESSIPVRFVPLTGENADRDRRR